MRLLKLTLLLCLIGIEVFASGNKFSVNKPSQWVEKINYSEGFDNSSDVEGGAIYLLADYQVNVENSEKYSRYVIKVINDAGTSSYADIWVNYDPAYQELVFHNISIHRNGKTYNRLDKAKVKIIQNETELDSKIFNGSYSAGYFIEDVQVGDIIEYSYTIKGENPIFGNSFFDILYLQFSTPIRKLHNAVRYPSSYKLNYKLFNTSAAPQKAVKDGYTLLKWEIDNVPEMIANSDMPSWYSPYPKVQLSSFSTWSDLITWGKKLYPTNITENQTLNKEFSEILSGANTLESEINATIQFVKEEIRYVGIEISEYSHKPRNPIEVYQKRFGDCKEKSFLLTYLLSKLGVESYVAYVNTNLKHRITEYLPAPTIFNHAIVAIEYNGSTYFVDPTITGQKGSFTHFYNGNYQQALIISSNTQGPSPIPTTSSEKVIINETYQVTDTSQPVKYTVHSKYYGSEADRMRNAFKTKTIKELENSFLNFYSTNHPKMKFSEKLTYTDDKVENCIEVTEKYEIESFWEYDSIANDRVGYIDATNLKYYITSPEQKNREHPFYLYYPITIENQIVFQHAKEVTVKEESREINNPNFNFKCNVYQNSKKDVTLEYRYSSLKDYVDTMEMSAYFKDYDDIRNATFYSFTWGNETPQENRINWIFAILTIFFLTILAFIANILYKKDIATPAVQSQLSVGGWLILPAIGISLTPLIILSQLLTTGYFSLSSWEFISMHTSNGYDFYWATAFVYELLFNCFFIAYSLLLITLLVKRRTTFPMHYISFRIINLAMLIIDLLLINQIENANFTSENSATREIIRSIVGSCIWIPYMIYSKRVKQTFVNTFNGKVENDQHPVKQID